MISVKRYTEILLQQKIIKYFFVGSSAAIIDITIFLIFAKILGFNYLIIGTIGFIIATFVNYYLSIRFVFTSNIRFSAATEVSLIYFISTIGLLLNLCALYVFIDILIFDKIISKMFASSSVFIWNFITRNNFVFRKLNLKN